MLACWCFERSVQAVYFAVLGQMLNAFVQFMSVYPQAERLNALSQYLIPLEASRLFPGRVDLEQLTRAICAGHGRIRPFKEQGIINISFIRGAGLYIVIIHFMCLLRFAEIMAAMG